MRTMKKVLSLSLVLAMAFSLVAGAAFKDEAKINADLMGDINMMVALGVFSENGTGEGNFDPTVELTREQAAKLLYVLKNKGNDNSSAYAGMKLFKDVEAGRWSEGYINWCGSTGVMIGTGDGMFNPTGKITGVEFAKMLLVLIGYKADAQGYVGNNWSSAVLRDADNAGMFVEYQLPVRGIVTREWAAKLMNNVINADKARYDRGELTFDPGVTFATKDLGVKTFTGVANGTAKLTLANNAEPTMHKDSKTSKIIVNVGADSKDISTEISYDVPVGLLGEEVKVLFKSTDDKYDAGEKVYGVVATGTTKVYTVNAKDITIEKLDDSKKATADSTIKFAGFNDGKAFKIGVATAKTYNNLVEANSPKIAEYLNGIKDSEAVVTILADKSNKISAIFTVLPSIYEVTAYAPASNRLDLAKGPVGSANINITKADDFKNVEVNGTIAKGDIVEAIYDYTTGVKKLHIAKADVVEGKVTKIVSGKATIDGVEYKVASNAISGTALPDLGKTVRVAVVGNYIVSGTVANASAAQQSNIVLVVATAAIKDDWSKESTINKVDILKADGTREIMTYVSNETEDKDASIVKFADVAKDNLYEYTTKDGKLALKKLAPVGDNFKIDSGKAVEFTKKTNKFTVDKQTILTNTDSYVFVKYNADTEGKTAKYAVVKTSEIKGDIAGTSASAVAYNTNNIPYLAYGLIVTNSDMPGAASVSSTVAIAATSEEQIINDKSDKEYNLTVTKLNGEKIVLKNPDSFGTVTGKFVTFEVDSTGKASVTAQTTADGLGFTKQDTLTAFDGKTVVIGGSVLTLADDAKIYYVDSTDTKTVVAEGSSLVTNGFEKTNNVIYKVKSTDANIITDIIVEIHGDAIVFPK